MTVLTADTRAAFAGNGTIASFPVPFKIWMPSDLKVYVRRPGIQTDVLQSWPSDYTLDHEVFPGTGNIVFAMPPGIGDTITILRAPISAQELDLQPNGAFAAENIEIALDKLTAGLQALHEQLARSWALPPGSTITHLPLPEPSPAVAGQVLGVTATGDAYELKAPYNLALQTVSSYIATLLDDADAATARATLGIGSAIDLNLLPTDTTGGVAADFVPFIDASEGNASNKVPVPNFFSVAMASQPVTVPADQTAFEVLARRASDGTLHRVRLADIAAGRQTIFVPAAAVIARTTAGPAAGTLELPINKVMLRTLDFDALIQEHAQFSVQMPKSWNEGQISALFVWSHGTASTNFNVVWAIRGLALSGGDSIDTPFGASAQVTATGGSANTHYRSSETAPFTLANTPAENDVVHFEIMRVAADPGDTLAIDARLHGLVLFFTTNANSDN